MESSQYMHFEVEYFLSMCRYVYRDSLCMDVTLALQSVMRIEAFLYGIATSTGIESVVIKKNTIFEWSRLFKLASHNGLQRGINNLTRYMQPSLTDPKSSYKISGAHLLRLVRIQTNTRSQWTWICRHTRTSIANWTGTVFVLNWGRVKCLWYKVIWNHSRDLKSNLWPFQLMNAKLHATRTHRTLENNVRANKCRLSMVTVVWVI